MPLEASWHSSSMAAFCRRGIAEVRETIGVHCEEALRAKHTPLDDVDEFVKMKGLPPHRH